MVAESENPRPTWFVGAAFSGYDDQTERFIQDGTWEGGPVERYGDQIALIQPGDRIAIKASYVRKNGLPFENRGEFVSVMAIKAIGVVVENLGDRRSLRVNWTPVDPPREWYFHTFRRTIVAVLPDEWWQQALMRFTFDGEAQDVYQTLRHPYWGDIYGYPKHPEEEPTEVPPHYEIGKHNCRRLLP